MQTRSMTRRRRAEWEDRIRRDRERAALRLPTDCKCDATMSAGDYFGNNPCPAHQRDEKVSHRIAGHYTEVCWMFHSERKEFDRDDPPYPAKMKTELERLLGCCRDNKAEARAAVAGMTHWDTKINMYNVYTSDLEERIQRDLAEHQFLE